IHKSQAPLENILNELVDESGKISDLIQKWHKKQKHVLNTKPHKIHDSVVLGLGTYLLSLVFNASNTPENKAFIESV
ncbi:hypothetical protein, partial [Staphylococcus aureus]